MNMSIYGNNMRYIMKYFIVFILLSAVSCSTNSKRCDFNECNDCGRMSSREKELRGSGGFNESGFALNSSGIRNDRKVRVLVLSSAVNKPLSVTAAKESARRIAIDGARRHVSELVKNEFSSSQHAADIEGVAIIYRGKSYAGVNGQKMFSDTIKEILDRGKIICIEYSVENRCIILLEYDLSPFDRSH